MGVCTYRHNHNMTQVRLRPHSRTERAGSEDSVGCDSWSGSFECNGIAEPTRRCDEESPSDCFLGTRSNDCVCASSRDSSSNDTVMANRTACDWLRELRLMDAVDGDFDAASGLSNFSWLHRSDGTLAATFVTPCSELAGYKTVRVELEDGRSSATLEDVEHGYISDTGQYPAELFETDKCMDAEFLINGACRPCPEGATW